MMSNTFPNLQRFFGHVHVALTRWPTVSAMTLSVYFGVVAASADQAGMPNADAPEVVDSLIANGGFESLDETSTDPSPLSWEARSADDTHLVEWVDGEARGGDRSVKVQVLAGAEARYTNWSQRGIAVKPGQKLRLTGYVKGQSIDAHVGIFVHGVTAGGKRVLNKVGQIEKSDFDWTRVRLWFTVPADTSELYVGTVLYGTGTAWYDDFELIEVE